MKSQNEKRRRRRKENEENILQFISINNLRDNNIQQYLNKKETIELLINSASIVYSHMTRHVKYMKYSLLQQIVIWYEKQERSCIAQNCYLAVSR